MPLNVKLKPKRPVIYLINPIFTQFTSDLFTIVSAGYGDPTWGDNPAITKEMLPATLETLAISAISGVFAVLLGIPLGLFCVATSKDGLIPNVVVNKITGFIIDLGRSIPFLILAVFLTPFTRLVVGTTVGWQASSIPLIIGATPFFARLVESNIMGVDKGKIEAAQMMGASRTQIMWGVQVREALPALMQSTTVLVITIIGYTAITGSLGGGGLGAMAINYGRFRWQSDTMIVSIVVIGIIVMAVQYLGDFLTRRVDHR